MVAPAPKIRVADKVTYRANGNLEKASVVSAGENGKGSLFVRSDDHQFATINQESVAFLNGLRYGGYRCIGKLDMTVTWTRLVGGEKILCRGVIKLEVEEALVRESSPRWQVTVYSESVKGEPLVPLNFPYDTFIYDWEIIQKDAEAVNKVEAVNESINNPEFGTW